MQVSQYLIFTVIPFTMTSLVRGNRNCGVWTPPTSLSPPLVSGSGGCVFRGMIPGSLPEVTSRRDKS